MAFSTAQYDKLERAITNGSRMSFFRRGTEFIVVPERLRVVQGRELIEARHPSTGHRLEILVEEIDFFEVIA